MQVALRGLGIAVSTAYGTPETNMACFLEPDCRDYANFMCYGLNFFSDKCSTWRNFEPTPGMIAANTTNYGGSLSPEAQQAATIAAQAQIAADMAAHPENYGELCPSGQIPQANGTCAPCPVGYTARDGRCIEGIFGIGSDLVTVGVLIGAALLLLALKR